MPPNCRSALGGRHTSPNPSSSASMPGVFKAQHPGVEVGDLCVVGPDDAIVDQQNRSCPKWRGVRHYRGLRVLAHIQFETSGRPGESQLQVGYQPCSRLFQLLDRKEVVLVSLVFASLTSLFFFARCYVVETFVQDLVEDCNRPTYTWHNPPDPRDAARRLA